MKFPQNLGPKATEKVVEWGDDELKKELIESLFKWRLILLPTSDLLFCSKNVDAPPTPSKSQNIYALERITRRYMGQETVLVG